MIEKNTNNMNKINNQQKEGQILVIKTKRVQSNLLMYFISIVVLAIIIVFWLQLKQQIHDSQTMGIQFRHQPAPVPHQINRQAEVKDKMPEVVPQIKVEEQKKQTMSNIVEKQDNKDKQNDGVTKQQQQNVPDQQKQIKNFVKPYDNFMFNTIQSWSKKKEVRKKFQQSSENYNRAPTPREGAYRPPQRERTKVQNPSDPNSPSSPSPPPKTPAGLLRANITAPQLDLAKRLQKAKNQPKGSPIANEQKEYFETKYKVSTYKQQPFCIVVPSFNNTAQNRYINNINSILMQDYSNYHIVFIDDASEDETGRLMKQFAADHQISEQKLRIIINQNRTMAMPNLYKAAREYCKPYEIFMIVDGDDQLLGRQVLKLFNSIFQSKDVWVAYTNFISIRGSIGYSRPYSVTTMERNSYRRSGFVISHLRAFYTKLFASVKEEDLQDENKNWFRAANDVAMYIPILEMSHKKVTYCPQLSYLYNSNTGLNNHRVKLKQQKGNQKKVKQKPAYKPLETLWTQQQKSELEQSLDKKVEIKNLSLPSPPFEVKKYQWES